MDRHDVLTTAVDAARFDDRRPADGRRRPAVVAIERDDPSVPALTSARTVACDGGDP